MSSELDINVLFLLAERAAAISDEAERNEFIDKQCPDDGYRKAVREVLDEIQTAGQEQAESLHAPAHRILLEALRESRSDALAATLHTAEQCTERYVLLGELGRGGQSRVERVLDRLLNREVARKRIALPSPVTHKMAARLFGEARALASLNHPNIPDIYDWGRTDSGEYFIVMPVLEHPTFSKWLTRLRASKPAPQGYPAILRIVTQCAHALEEAHRHQLIHRDVKPDNILIRDNEAALLIDWGVAAYAQSQEAPTGDGAAPSCRDDNHTRGVGTARFMAPEQDFGSAAPLGPWTDVYSLGATLLHALLPEPPSQEALRSGEATAKLKELGYPRSLRAIIRRTTALDYRDRYHTASELASDLQAFLDHRTVRAYQASPLEHAYRWTRRHARRLVTLAGVLAVCLIIFGSSRSARAAEGRSLHSQLASSFAQGDWAATREAYRQLDDLGIATLPAGLLAAEACYYENDAGAAREILDVLQDDALAHGYPPSAEVLYLAALDPALWSEDQVGAGKEAAQAALDAGLQGAPRHVLLALTGEEPEDIVTGLTSALATDRRCVVAYLELIPLLTIQAKLSSATAHLNSLRILYPNATDFAELATPIAELRRGQPEDPYAGEPILRTDDARFVEAREYLSDTALLVENGRWLPRVTILRKYLRLCRSLQEPSPLAHAYYALQKRTDPDAPSSWTPVAKSLLDIQALIPSSHGQYCLGGTILGLNDGWRGLFTSECEQMMACIRAFAQASEPGQAATQITRNATWYGLRSASTALVDLCPDKLVDEDRLFLEGYVDRLFLQLLKDPDPPELFLRQAIWEADRLGRSKLGVLVGEHYSSLGFDAYAAEQYLMVQYFREERWVEGLAVAEQLLQHDDVPAEIADSVDGFRRRAAAWAQQHLESLGFRVSPPSTK